MCMCVCARARTHTFCLGCWWKWGGGQLGLRAGSGWLSALLFRSHCTWWSPRGPKMLAEASQGRAVLQVLTWGWWPF